MKPKLDHPLAAAMRKVDLFVPMLTRDPTIKLVDIAHILGVRAANRESMTEESRASVPAVRRAERRQLVERLRALQAEARDCPDGATKAAMAQAREALRLLDSGR